MPDLNSLYTFAIVVESGSFSRAARQLGMPTSTVSRRVAELEAELGVKLLERSTRSLRLTEMGTEIYPQARIAADVASTVDGLVHNAKPDVSGTLRISAPPNLSDTILAPIVTAFQERHPDTRVQALVTGRFVDLAADGIDVGFIVGPLRDQKVGARKLLTYRHQLVASPSYVNANGEPTHPDELRERRVFKFNFWDDNLPWTLMNVHTGESRRPELRPALSMNDYAGLLFALQRGAGITSLPPIVQPELVRQGRLIEVMRDWRFSPMDLTATFLSSRNVPRLVRLFVEFSEEMLTSLFPDLPT